MNRTNQQFVIAMCAFLFVCTKPLAADEWTNLRGTGKISGILHGIWNGRALMQLEDGRQVSVKLDDLNAESRIRAQNQQQEIDKRMRNRVGELIETAHQANASKPTNLPSPPPTPHYAPPQDGADLQTTLDHIQTQAKAGHLRVYYDALPKSQQIQANELFKLGLQKLDQRNWELFRATLHHLAELTVERQRWLFSHPKFESLSENERKSLLVLASAFRQWGTADIATLEKLQNSSLEGTLQQLDEIISPYLNQILDDNPAIATLAFPSYQAEKGPDGKVSAQIVLPFVGTVQSVPMVQIEDRWVEGATVQEAQNKWNTYKKSIESIPNESLRLSREADILLTNLSSSLKKLEATKDRTAFHRALDDELQTLIPSINAWAGVVLPAAVPNAQGDSGPQQGFDPGRSSEAAGRAAAEAASAAAQQGRP